MFNRKIQKTKEPENLGKAYEYAVFLLSLRLRTVGEVLKKMRQRGYTGKVIGVVIERLKNQKYLDDERYAEIFLENLKTYRTFGYYGIKKKLMQKNLSNELVDRLLSENLSIDDEISIGERFLGKEGYEIKKRSLKDEIEYQTYSDPEDETQKQKQRMVNKLKSKGFRGEVVARLLF